MVLQSAITGTSFILLYQQDYWTRIDDQCNQLFRKG